MSRRKVVDVTVRSACVLATLFAIIPLASILYYVVVQGAGGLSFDFFTELPAPAGESGGGMANAIVGSLTIVGLACAFGLPFGIMAGIYVAEYGGNRFARSVRFAADVMSGIPSIVVGIFAYTTIVLTMKRFSALAGGVALGILMIPTVTRTTEELLRMVPDSLREAALALGVPKWRTTLQVVLRTAAPGIATGIMLAVARIAGESAPLLFTALGNDYWPQGLDDQTASLPVQIYTYAKSPYPDWQQKAWAAALVLVGMVLFFNILARVFVRRRS
jgi:phosphate transport system permease protein